MDWNKISIVGSGLGGLLTAFLLSKEGMDVTVLEKHRKFGGCLQSFQRDRYSFDTGMHYIGSMAPGQPLHNYWKYFGLSDRLDLLKMDENGFDRISYYGTEYPLAQGYDNFKERLLPYFPDEASALNTYTQKLNEIANSHPLYNLELPAGSYSNHYESVLAGSFLSDLSSGIRHPASSIRLADVLAGNNFLYAGNPATTPLSQFGLINHSFISSAWRVKGGSQQIAELLVEGIRCHGGTVLAKKMVAKIERSEEGYIVTTADGDQFESGQVISDIHPEATLKLLHGFTIQKAFRERITSLPNTTSVFSIYLGLKPETFPFLNHNVYHHRSSNVWTDAQFLFMTPPGKEQGIFANTAVIMSPMDFAEVKEWENSDSGAREKNYFVFKAKKAKLLLDAVYKRFPQLKEAVVTIEISTPLTWRDYTGTPEGSMYGIVKDATNPLKTTLFPKTKIPGLYFTGQSVNLHGALGVTIGSVMTCGEILGLPHVLKAIKQLS
ncbi:MAG: NAD(P)/FAD-dependent oxidoreductase [Bacteroidales bacterium]|nr:NAD(P)/FAD-dependent oxidoreductase [Bacteroidales bacterium]